MLGMPSLVIRDAHRFREDEACSIWQSLAVT
jgi:hypothetical protein